MKCMGGPTIIKISLHRNSKPFEIGMLIMASGIFSSNFHCVLNHSALVLYMVSSSSEPLPKKGKRDTKKEEKASAQ